MIIYESKSTIAASERLPCDLLDGAVRAFSDTDRLNYLLQFIRIDDVGDEDYSMGIVVRHEAMEENIGYGPMKSSGIMAGMIRTWDDDIREVIDRAMAAHDSSNKNMSESKTELKPKSGNQEDACPREKMEEMEISRNALQAALLEMLDMWERTCTPRNIERDSQVISARAALSLYNEQDQISQSENSLSSSHT